MYQCGGEGGIRTHVTLSGKPVFETGLINRSSTSPRWDIESETGGVALSEGRSIGGAGCGCQSGPPGLAFATAYFRNEAMTLSFVARGQSRVFTRIGNVMVSSILPASSVPVRPASPTTAPASSRNTARSFTRCLV